MSSAIAPSATMCGALRMALLSSQAAATPGVQSAMSKGIGMPVLSGQHRVGCMDVMPLCKGDDSGLLFRLFYPTEANPDSRYHYPPWLPNELYAKGLLSNERLQQAVGTRATIEAFGPLTSVLRGE